MDKETLDKLIEAQVQRISNLQAAGTFAVQEEAEALESEVRTLDRLLGLTLMVPA